MTNVRTGKKFKMPKLRYIIIIAAVIAALLGLKRFTDFSGYYKKGKEFYEREMINEAIAEWEKAARINPWSAKILMSLSLLYMRTGDYEKAFDYAGKTVEVRPNYERAFVILGQVCFHLGRGEEENERPGEARKFYRKGIDAYKKALSFTKSADAIHYLGSAYLCLGEYDEGIVFFTEKTADNEDAEDEVKKLMEVKKEFLAGSGPVELIGGDTWGPVPFGSEIAVIGHPIFKFSRQEKESFRNGIFYADIDGDRKTDLVLIYRMPISEDVNSYFVSVFNRTRNKWAPLRWNTRLSGSDVGYFTVEDINGDERPEIVVEGIHDIKAGAILNIYGYKDSSYKTLQQIGPTWGTTLIDLDSDGTKEIVILDKKREEYRSITYKWNGSIYVKIDD